MWSAHRIPLTYPLERSVQGVSTRPGQHQIFSVWQFEHLRGVYHISLLTLQR